MRIEQFIYLVDIQKTKSITKTAENFFISRQVVSASIRALEEELGFQLLVREKGNLQFTAIGEIAVEKAHAVVAAYQDFLNSIINPPSSDSQIKQGVEISIYTIPRLAATMIPGMISQFRSLYPEIELRVVTQSSEKILDSVAEKENSIGFISYPDKVSNNNMNYFRPVLYPTLIIKPLIASSFYICLRKNSRYFTKTVFNIEDLMSLPIISYVPAYNNMANNPPPALNIVSEVNDFITMFSLVKQDLGVGIITLKEFNFFNNDKDIILVPINVPNDTTLHFASVFNESSAKNLYIQEFIKLSPQYYHSKTVLGD